MNKFRYIFASVVIATTCLSACKDNTTLLDPSDPVALTMWHVYGEQVDSPMNKYIQEFNTTEGKEKGIVINVTMLSDASKIGGKLLDAQADKPGTLDMPDLFFCHGNNAAELGVQNLVDWRSQFPEEELSDYTEGFLADGIVDGTLCVFPVSKSTHMLFLAGGAFGRFTQDAEEAGVTVTQESLSTWDGFFQAAEIYYNLYGKPFCAVDYLLRCVELNAMSETDAASFYTDEGWYDTSCESFKTSYMRFAESLANGHIIVSDQYANTQMATGEVIAGIGSSASVLYYNDTITYSDNSSEPMDLIVLPLPQPKDAQIRYAT